MQRYHKLKKLALILIITNLFTGCEARNDKVEFKKTEFYYPGPTSITDTLLLERIYLDSIKNFGELNALANQLACNEKWPLLVFETGQAKFHFQLYKECSDIYDIVDFSERNIISIQNDSIVINDQLQMPFDSLKTILKNHILNPKRELSYSKSMEKAFIFYYQDSLFSSQRIKDQLIQISTEFNSLNKEHGDSLPLNIKLSDYPYLRPFNPSIPG